MRHLVTFLVSDPDESTDTVQAFAQDVAHLYGPAYLGIIDYAVRVDVPSCFVLDGSETAKATVDECLDALRPVGTWTGEPGSPADRAEPIYNRESYFN